MVLQCGFLRDSCNSQRLIGEAVLKPVEKILDWRLEGWFSEISDLQPHWSCLLNWALWWLNRTKRVIMMMMMNDWRDGEWCAALHAHPCCPYIDGVHVWMQVCVLCTSPGTVGGGDWRSALHSGDEGRLEIKQVTVQIGHAGEQKMGGGEGVIERGRDVGEQWRKTKHGGGQMSGSINS